MTGAPLDPIRLPLSTKVRACRTRKCDHVWQSFETEIDLDASAAVTAYLGNGGALEQAQSMAAHESPRTTQL
jgi:hypothetical protein